MILSIASQQISDDQASAIRISVTSLSCVNVKTSVPRACGKSHFRSLVMWSDVEVLSVREWRREENVPWWRRPVRCSEVRRREEPSPEIHHKASARAHHLHTSHDTKHTSYTAKYKHFLSFIVLPHFRMIRNPSKPWNDPIVTKNNVDFKHPK